MKTFALILSVLLLLSASCSDLGSTTKIKVGVLLMDETSPEARNLLKWFQFQPDLEFQTIHPESGYPYWQESDVVWIHLTDEKELERIVHHQNIRKQFLRYWQAGGKLLLTDLAAVLPYHFGLESRKPEIKTLEIKDDWNFDKKGLQSYRGHPVFHELFGGTYIFDGTRDQKVKTVGYYEDHFPVQGKVVAVEKSYIRIHSRNRLMLEYMRDHARMLTIGGFVYFSRQNLLHYRRDKLLTNCFFYLTGKLTGEPITYWEQYPHRPREFDIHSMNVPQMDSRRFIASFQSDLKIASDYPSRDYYDVAGRRCLVMGKEKAGIDEVWTHPFRVVRDYQEGIVVAGEFHALEEFPVRMIVYPEAFYREYQLPSGTLQELIYASFNQPGALVHYEWQGTAPLQLVIRFRSDLRWMWPYDENAIGDVWYGYDSTLSALHLHDSAGELYGILGANLPPVQRKTGAFDKITWKSGTFVGEPTDLNQVYHAFLYHLEPQKQAVLNFAIVGTNWGHREALQTYVQLLQGPEKELNRLKAHTDSLFSHMVVFHTPDEAFNRWWKWALVGTDRFLVNTPGVGTALVAGYATTARGWDGGHKINGRPGYAWYFGRDSEWSGFAIDNYGDFELVRQQLRFLQQYQDLNGKIFHEISTSGVVHYDAADATPLYIILAAHYLRSSGDVPFIRQSWPHIQKAMEFLYSTDTDHDHLIENTNVGHGWVEGGKLWGANTTFYLAALWTQTLRDAAYMADVLGKNSLKTRYQNDYELVRQIVAEQFWNDSTKFYNYGKFADGSMNTEPTLLPAVAMYFEIPPRNRVENMLLNYASNDYSTDWGVRIVSARSPLFNPRGYHYGSVWPLFTGWAALAEYAYQHPVSGFTHILNNMLIKNFWEKGFVEEVMNGAVYEPGGVCPHQCWSETNIIHPAIHGMLGWRPDALNQQCTVQPHFPVQWDRVTVENLRVGDSQFTMVFERTGEKSVYRFQRTHGGDVTIHLIPQTAAGGKIISLQIDGEKYPLYQFNKDGYVKLRLSGEGRVEVHCKGGIEVVPLIPHPAPGETSRGRRIVGTAREGKTYYMLLEGKPEDRFKIQVRTFGSHIQSVIGAEQLGTDERNITTLQVLMGHSREPFVRKRVKIVLK